MIKIYWRKFEFQRFSYRLNDGLFFNGSLWQGKIELAAAVLPGSDKDVKWRPGGDKKAGLRMQG